MYGKYIKRFLDIVCALLAITVFSWLYILVAVLVRINLGRPVIFKQERPGKNGRIFCLYKFRTMTDKKDKNGVPLPDAQRLTRFGKFLRKTSLDELPEAFNILKGDMSVVGPRPLLCEYLNYYSEEEMHRHDVSPGLTGLAQVSGRNLLSWEERFQLDLEYVKKVSFFLDVKIVLLTVWKAFFKEEGITPEGSETNEAFRGNENGKVAVK